MMYVGKFFTKKDDFLFILIVEMVEEDKKAANEEEKDPRKIKEANFFFSVSVNGKEKNKSAIVPFAIEEDVIDEITNEIFAKFAEEEGITLEEFNDKWMLDTRELDRPAQLECDVLNKMHRVVDNWKTVETAI